MKAIILRLAVSGLCIFLLWIGLIVAAAHTEPIAQQIPADTASTSFRGFELPEQSGDHRYRWTKGNAFIAIPAHASVTRLIVDLELTGPQWKNATPANLNIRLDQGPAIQLIIPPAWRHYRLLLPRGAVGWGVPQIHLAGPTQSPGVGDSRNLGVALTQIRIVSVPEPFSRAAIERGTFLLILILALGTIVFFSGALKWSIGLMSVCGILLTIVQWLFPVFIDTLLPVDWQIGGLVATAVIVPFLGCIYGTLLARSVAGIVFVSFGALFAFDRTWVLFGILLIIGGVVLISGAIPAWRRHERRSVLLIRLGGLALGLPIVLLFTYHLGTFDLVHPDELFWMQAGRRAFQLFFVEHNYTDPFWFNFDQYFLAFHPQIGKFFIGASVAAAGIPVIPYQLFDWSQNVAWNMQHGFQVDPTALLAARMPIAIMAVITCLALYWLNVMVTSWWHGVLAALYLAGNSDMFRIGRFAMIDMPALCFSLLTIVLVVRVVQALRSGQHGLGWAAIAGVMAGLAVGAKLIAVILVAPAVLALLYEALRCRWKRVGSASKTLVSAILLSGVAALLFYGSNPLLYHQPIAGTLQMLDFVRMIQNSNTYNPTSTPIQRIAAVWENPTFSGPFAHIGLPIDQLLILLGCFVIGIDLWRLPAVRQYHPLDTVVIWMIGSMLMITISLPANLDRYLLPLQPIMAFLQAYGTIWVAHRVVMLVRKRFGSVSTTEASNIY